MFEQDLVKFYVLFKSKTMNRDVMVDSFVRLMIKYGKAYHWDNKASEIISGKTDSSLFSPEECVLLDQIVEELYGDEMWDLTIKLQEEYI